jgi:hypothetical protein
MPADCAARSKGIEVEAVMAGGSAGNISFKSFGRPLAERVEQ